MIDILVKHKDNKVKVTSMELLANIFANGKLRTKLLKQYEHLKIKDFFDTFENIKNEKVKSGLASATSLFLGNCV